MIFPWSLIVFIQPKSFISSPILSMHSSTNVLLFFPVIFIRIVIGYDQVDKNIHTSAIISPDLRLGRLLYPIKRQPPKRGFFYLYKRSLTNTKGGKHKKSFLRLNTLLKILLKN